MYGSLAVMASEGSGSVMSQSGHRCNIKLSAVSQLSLRGWAIEAILLQGEVAVCWKAGKKRGHLEEEKLRRTLNCNFIKNLQIELEPANRVLSRKKNPYFLLVFPSILFGQRYKNDGLFTYAGLSYWTRRYLSCTFTWRAVDYRIVSALTITMQSYYALPQWIFIRLMQLVDLICSRTTSCY